MYVFKHSSLRDGEASARSKGKKNQNVDGWIWNNFQWNISPMVEGTILRLKDAWIPRKMGDKGGITIVFSDTKMIGKQKEQS